MLSGRFQRLHVSPDPSTDSGHRGTLWLITDQGVARLMDTIWDVYLADFTGELAGIDAAGRAWVVSEDTTQITAWDGASWTAYGADEGWLPIALEDDWYRDVGWGKSDGLGRFWLATSQDVRVFDGGRGQWTVFAPEDMGMGEVGPEELWPSFTIGILQGAEEVWVGECDWCGPGPFGGQGVRWFDGRTWRGADSPVSAGCATVIEEDGQGRIWMGVEENLWRYDSASGGWTEFTPPEPPISGMRFGFAHAVAFDPSDDPWPAMVLCGGASCYGKIALYHIQDGAWTQIGEAMEFGGGVPPHELVADATGMPWLFWGGGIYRIAEDAPELAGNLYARSIVVDATGQVWFVAWHEGRDVLWTLNAEAGD